MACCCASSPAEFRALLDVGEMREGGAGGGVAPGEGLAVAGLLRRYRRGEEIEIALEDQVRRRGEVELDAEPTLRRHARQARGLTARTKSVPAALVVGMVIVPCRLPTRAVTLPASPVWLTAAVHSR